MNSEEIKILSTVIEDMYGSAFNSYTGTVKCIMKITGTDKMKMTCMTVVNLGNRTEMQTAARESEAMLKKHSAATLTRVKKEFKERAGRALKTKQVSSDSSVELMNYHAYSDKGTCLVRQEHDFEIS